MTKYDIPLRVKISDKEFDKLKNKTNRSKYVRDAINSYYGEMAKEIEISKKKVLEEIKEEIQEEQKKFKEKMLKEQKTHEKTMLSKINKMYAECEFKLKEIMEETKEYENLNLTDVKEKTDEEKIMEILPLLRRIYNSDNGMSYERIRQVAFNMDISPFKLKQWIEDNENELKIYTDTMNDRIKSKPGRVHKFNENIE